MAATQRLTDYQALAPSWSCPSSRILSPVLSRSNSQLYTYRERSNSKPESSPSPARESVKQSPNTRPEQPTRAPLPRSNTYRQQRSRRISRSPKRSTDQPSNPSTQQSTPESAPTPPPKPKKESKNMAQNQAGGSSRKISFNVSEQYDIQDVVGEGAYGVVWYVLHAGMGCRCDGDETDRWD